jgi:hypothetical protein
VKVRKQETIGYAMVGLAVVLVLLGTVGFTVEGELTNITTPTVPERTFFADDPLPEQSFAVFVSATLTLTWDRDDIYVVIADEDEKNTCESQPTGIFNEGGSNSCGPFDTDLVASGSNGQDGLVWEVQEGTYFAGIGTLNQGGLPEGTMVDLAYSVDLQAGFATYFIFALIGVGGLAYSRVE